MSRINQAMQDLLKYNHAIVPDKRSAFNKSHSHATTLDSGWLVPLMWDRVVPGDEKKIRYSGLCNMATPLHATMDEAYLYTWAFYVPDRLWWRNAKAFYGENLDADFNPDGEYVMPSLDPGRYLTWASHTLNDYLGTPFIVDAFEMEDDRNDNLVNGVCAGLWRSYQLIWNEYYRNSSVQPALRLNDGDIVTHDEYEIIKELRLVNKLPDMFTSLLREPQSGEDVILPIADYAPVITRQGEYVYQSTDSPSYMTNFYSVDGIVGVNGVGVDGGPNTVGISSDVGSSYRDKYLVPSNLWADLGAAVNPTINQLRAAVTIQQFMEISAIGGKRYQNLIFAHYGVFTPDATLQRPELLGASKTRIGMRQVLGTVTNDDTRLGQRGGVSVTNVDNEWVCNKAFTEPGFIMILGCVRPMHSYSQGVNPLLRKLNTYDHYYPVFDNIGNQPVYTSELFVGVDQPSFQDGDYFNKVFGWKEAWIEYRTMDNRVSGLFRPDVPGSLASWNYTTYLREEPFLNSDFIQEDPSLIDRTIAVPGEPQFLLDSYFDYIDIKNMSVHSTPGLFRL